MYTNAEQAIADSIRQNKVAHFAEHNSQIAEILERDCENSVETNGVLEFSGTIESGAEWRVNMAVPMRPAKSRDQALREANAEDARSTARHARREDQY